MDIYATILKDALMVDVYDCERNLVLLDLSSIEQVLSDMTHANEEDLETTLLINAVIALLENKHMAETRVSELLSAEMRYVTEQYKQFDKVIRMNKLKSLATLLGQIRYLTFALRDIFEGNNLYNHSGVLQVMSIDVQHMSAAVASVRSKQCPEHFKTNRTLSILGTPSQYLRTILISC